MFALMAPPHPAPLSPKIADPRPPAKPALVRHGEPHARSQLPPRARPPSAGDSPVRMRYACRLNQEISRGCGTQMGFSKANREKAMVLAARRCCVVSGQRRPSY